MQYCEQFKILLIIYSFQHSIGQRRKLESTKVLLQRQQIQLWFKVESCVHLSNWQRKEMQPDGFFWAGQDHNSMVPSTHCTQKQPVGRFVWKN